MSFRLDNPIQLAKEYLLEPGFVELAHVQPRMVLDIRTHKGSESHRHNLRAASIESILDVASAKRVGHVLIESFPKDMPGYCDTMRMCMLGYVG